MTVLEGPDKLLMYEMALAPFLRDKNWKQSTFRNMMISLTRRHQKSCLPYSNILATAMHRIDDDTPLQELPFMPVSLFKHLDLCSVEAESVRHVLRSSGTTGKKTSSIYVDKHTSLLQMQALSCILSDYLGKKSLPVLIIDCPDVLAPNSRYSARAAGIQGFSMFGQRKAFALNNDMQPDIEVINSFLSASKGGPFLVFGFTFIIWKYFINRLNDAQQYVDFNNAILIHGGGRKNLNEAFVSDEVFKETLQRHTGITRCYNYYGMVEQTGSIYMQCENGYLHCSSLSEVFTRRPADFSLCEQGEPGIIQSMSLIPHSYPGHNLLTEDEGTILGEDNCSCGRKGKFFKISGRLLEAEIKGCGDDINR